MATWAIEKRDDFSSSTLTVVEILPQTSTSPPSTSFKPSLSRPSLTTATKSQVNSLPSQISTTISSKPLISSSSSSVSSSSSSVSSFSSSVPSSSSTLSPPTSSGVHSSQITKSAPSLLNSGDIAGIVIACVVLSLIGTFFAIRVWFKKRASKLRKNWMRSFVGVEPFHETPGKLIFLHVSWTVITWNFQET